VGFVVLICYVGSLPQLGTYADSRSWVHLLASSMSFGGSHMTFHNPKCPGESCASQNKDSLMFPAAGDYKLLTDEQEVVFLLNGRHFCCCTVQFLAPIIGFVTPHNDNSM